MKHSQEFLEKKKIVEFKEKFILIQHKLEMQRLEYARETMLLSHDRNLQRLRIKSAEIRRTFERKQGMRH